jgi:hypothetical protein
LLLAFATIVIPDFSLLEIQDSATEIELMTMRLQAVEEEINAKMDAYL